MTTAAVALGLATASTGPARADDRSGRGHREPRYGLDLRVAVPDGVGVTATMSPGPRITVGLGLGTTLGTVAITPEITVALRPGRTCTPTATAKISTVIFTPLIDGVINDQLARIYGDQVTVAMAGRTMEVLQGLVGVDCRLARLHLLARVGYAWEPFASFGGDDTDGDLVIRDWHGPALDLGLRWSL